MIEPVIFIRVLIAHFAADFLLQSSKIILSKREKRWKSCWLYIHALVYSVLVYVAFSLWSQVYWLIPVLFITHLLVDGYKSGKRDTSLSFILDQIAHIIVLLVAWIFASPRGFEAAWSFISGVWQSQEIILIALGYVLIIWPFGFFVGYITEPFRSQLAEAEARGLEKAGFWIGCLERILVYSFIIVGYPEAIALLVAAKSVFRFGEIKDPGKRKETEYILIGSLLSFGLAMVTGFVISKFIE